MQVLPSIKVNGKMASMAELTCRGRESLHCPCCFAIWRLMAGLRFPSVLGVLVTFLLLALSRPLCTVLLLVFFAMARLRSYTLVLQGTLPRVRSSIMLNRHIRTHQIIIKSR
jgi:hypothetical protein